MMRVVDIARVARITEELHNLNAQLDPRLVTADLAKELIAEFSRVRRAADFALATLTRKLSDVETVARATGTSLGQARATIETGKALETAPALGNALQQGDVSLEQASEIAKAVGSAPAAAPELVKVAKEESFKVLRERSQKAKLDAERHRDLATRQRMARFGRNWTDPLGMIHIEVALEAHVGAPIVARAGGRS